MEREKVNLMYGKEYELFGNFNGGFLNSKTINAVYIGYIPPQRGNHPISDGWGHLFFRENEGIIELYLSKNREMVRLCDGEDDPSYPVGIDAGRTNRVVLSKEEIEYLQWMAKRQNKGLALAA
ncbi:MAG: hypothetical protein WC796_00825 [Candidatus Pacearchaeota archaeon]|jgi:hypothetical protein